MLPLCTACDRDWEASSSSRSLDGGDPWRVRLLARAAGLTRTDMGMHELVDRPFWSDFRPYCDDEAADEDGYTEPWSYIPADVLAQAREAAGKRWPRLSVDPKFRRQVELAHRAAVARAAVAPRPAQMPVSPP